MPITIGGNTCRFTRTKGDIAASFQYVNDEPAMCIFPMAKRSNSGSYILCESAVFQLTDNFFLQYNSWLAAHITGFGVPKPPMYQGQYLSAEQFLASFVRNMPMGTKDQVSHEMELAKAKATEAIPKVRYITAMADCFLLWIDDLLMMPPKPDDLQEYPHKRMEGEATLSIDGNKQTVEMVH